jgi:hypothetical protein
MNQCTANNHRLEFREDIGGIATYICLDCGETIHQYSDHQGC